MYLTVCPLCGRGSIPAVTEYFKGFSRQFLSPHLDSSGAGPASRQGLSQLTFSGGHNKQIGTEKNRTEASLKLLFMVHIY